MRLPRVSRNPLLRIRRCFESDWVAVRRLQHFQRSVGSSSLPVTYRVRAVCVCEDLVICVVRPDAEAPLVAADEVGVPVGDAERTRLFSYAFQRLRSLKPRRSPPSADFSPTRFSKELAAFARGDAGPHRPKPGERTSEVILPPTPSPGRWSASPAVRRHDSASGLCAFSLRTGEFVRSHWFRKGFREMPAPTVARSDADLAPPTPRPMPCLPRPMGSPARPGVACCKCLQLEPHRPPPAVVVQAKLKSCRTATPAKCRLWTSLTTERIAGRGYSQRNRGPGTADVDS